MIIFFSLFYVWFKIKTTKMRKTPKIKENRGLQNNKYDNYDKKL